MKAEEYFQNWWQHSKIADWVNLNESLGRDIYYRAFRDGRQSVWDELDRETLELLMQELDQQDMLDEQEELSHGRG